MSNPGVITLIDASSKKGAFKRFVIEDNIGEAIHLHIDNMKIDFTIKEFLEFSQMVRESLNRLDFLFGYSIENFDEHFLKECADFLPKLQKITIEEIKLSKLKAIVRLDHKNGLKLKKLVPVNKTPAYKFLQGDKKEFLSYDQFNYFGENNEKRLLDLMNLIKKNGYPYQNKYLVLFNGENIIRDGQHRAAVLAYLYGLDKKVKIIRFHFSGRDHLMNINKNNFKAILKWVIKKYCTILKKYLNDLKNKNNY